MKVLMDKPAPVASSATAPKKETDTDNNSSFLNFMAANLTPTDAEMTEAPVQNIESKIELLEEKSQSEQEVTALDQLLAGIQQTTQNENEVNPVVNQTVEKTAERIETNVPEEALVTDVTLTQKDKRTPLSFNKNNTQAQSSAMSEQRLTASSEQESITVNNSDTSISADNTQIGTMKKPPMPTQKLTSTLSTNELDIELNTKLNAELNKNELNRKVDIATMAVQSSVQMSAVSTNNKAIQYEVNQQDNSLTSLNLSSVQQAVNPESFTANRASAPGHMASAMTTPTNVSMRIDFIEQLRGKSISQGVHHIDIHITPPELGPVTAKLRIDNNKVDLEIMAKNSDVVNIIKSQLSALREQFDDANLRLNSVNVQNSDHFKQRDNERSQPEQSASDQYSLTPSSKALKTNEKMKKASDALIDTYI